MSKNPKRNRFMRQQDSPTSNAKSPPPVGTGRVLIAPRVWITSFPGSMYATMLKVLASLGRFDRHDILFKAFARVGTLAAAKQLIQQIGVSRAALEEYVRVDDEFREHCANRTRAYKNRAARGDKKAKSILRDRKICDARERWIGDIDEGITILSGAHSKEQVERGKNLQILNKAGLMFRKLELNGQVFCVLYSNKHHRVFLKAANLVSPPPKRRAYRHA